VTASAAARAVRGAVREARPRRFLMCPPTHFAVRYRVNPWMDPGRPVDRHLALAQWDRLVSRYRELGHEVELLEPLADLPDMVFAANGATVVDGKVLSARFRYPQRATEAAAHVGWFRDRGYPVHEAEHVNEGEGDLLVTGSRILAGTGFRSDPASHAEAARVLGRPVLGLTLVDPRFYHLDTALAVLDDDEIMYYPPAFSAGSRALLRRLYPTAVRVCAADAAVLGVNAVSDGRHVLLPQQARLLHRELAGRGFDPIGIDLSELLKSGGSVKCCTLELREAP
jgi:N-dimethylarginine dimethylaminohydrolase